MKKPKLILAYLLPGDGGSPEEVRHAFESTGDARFFWRRTWTGVPEEGYDAVYTCSDEVRQAYEQAGVTVYPGKPGKGKARRKRGGGSDGSDVPV